MSVYQATPRELQALRENSQERLTAAKVMIEKKLYRDSVSRSYYAILDAARALLLVSGHFAKTHSGVLTLFNLKFVQAGSVSAHYARLFKEAQKYREEADYEFLEKITKKEAQDVYKKAKRFVEMADKKLAQAGKQKGAIRLKTILL